jgi:glycosyltransferase involved in cell wall biosynthesis
VDDGGSGFICEDVAALARALKQMTDPAVREKLSRGALGFSKERLDWDENVKRVLKLTEKP